VNHQMRAVVLDGLLVGLILGTTSCSQSSSITEDQVARSESSAAMAVWTPDPLATCTAAEHNRYSAIGADGKQYPTWHPRVDTVSGCDFGHEHGSDPRGSRLYQATGAIPFGLAPEALAMWDTASEYREDHTAYKVVWENGVMLQQVIGRELVDIGVRCDFLMKIDVPEQESSAERLHELAYHVKCDDGTEVHATRMTTLAQAELTANYLTTAEGAHLAFFDPQLVHGEPPHRGLIGESPILSQEVVQVNQTGVYNDRGPTIWYTDPLGGGGSTQPFPGSIRQYIAAVNNDRGFTVESQVFALNR
jgi:hypothetical protein